VDRDVLERGLTPATGGDDGDSREAARSTRRMVADWKFKAHLCL